jgi:Alcohol dehydrogenase GroES-like domain
MSSARQQRMKRVVIDQFGGPEVLRVVEDDIPQPGPGEVRVRVLAAGVSFSDALLRAGVYLGGPKPPFTPGYELVGVVEELGPGCSRLRVGDRVAALTVWGADAEHVCVPEAHAVEVPEDLAVPPLMSPVGVQAKYALRHERTSGGTDEQASCRLAACPDSRRAPVSLELARTRTRAVRGSTPYWALPVVALSFASVPVS